MTTWRPSPPLTEPPTLIVSDVDGTLINDDDVVGPLTRTTVARAHDDGTPLVLATGRPPRWVPQIAEQVASATYAVCANGAIVYDIAHDAVLYAAVLQPGELARLIDIARTLLPECGIATERAGASAYDATIPNFVAGHAYQHAWLDSDHVMVDDSEVGAQPAVKLLVRNVGMRSSEMASLLAEPVGELASITFSTDDGLIEMALPDVDKASGVRVLADIASLPTDRVIAFGDMPNDVEMLRWAWRGVAMANAHETVRAAADEITTTNNDQGVGRVLARWFH